MAQVSDLVKLNREHLNEFAKRNGVEEPENLEKYKTKADLANVVSPVVTPEQLAEFRVEMGIDKPSGEDDGSDNGSDDAQGDETNRAEVDATHADEATDKPLETVTPQSATPADGESVLVDRSAPADDNIAEIENGEREGEGELAPVQPGDPKVRTNEGGVVTERDATTEEVENATNTDEPRTITEAQAREEQNDFGGDNGQRDADAEVEENPTVKLKNPSGREVEVRIADVAHQKMFAAGFTTIEGEDYPDEIVALEDAYKNNLHARNIYNDVDDSDPQQSMSKGDVARRKGSKETGESDGKPQAKVAAPKNDTKPVTFDGVDKRENGQVVNPKTSNPLKSNRLSQALKG